VQRLGEKTAIHPKKQMLLKIEPIRVFLQGMFSVAVGGKNTSITVRNNPSKAITVRYAMSKPRTFFGNTDHHLSEQIFDLLHDTLSRHVPVKLSFQRFPREDSADSSTP